MLSADLDSDATPFQTAVANFLAPDSEPEIEAEHPPKKKLKTIDFQGFVSTPEIDGSDTEPELQTIAFQGFASTPEIEGEHPSKKKLTLISKADTTLVTAALDNRDLLD